MPVNSADLSFVPKTLIAHCLTATGVNSMKRLPTAMIGDAAGRTTAAVSSPAATAAPAANSAITTMALPTIPSDILCRGCRNTSCR